MQAKPDTSISKALFSPNFIRNLFFVCKAVKGEYIRKIRLRQGGKSITENS